MANANDDLSEFSDSNYYSSSDDSSSSSSDSEFDDGDRHEASCCGFCCCCCHRRARKRWVRNYVPRWMRVYGKTTYGGDPALQQTLPTYFNYASPFWYIPVFLVFAVVFILVGVFTLLASRERYLFDINYSDINQYQYLPADPAVNINQGLRTFTAEGRTTAQGTATWVHFTLEKSLKAPVYFFYTIDHMYQNNRDWGDGRSTEQLRGGKKGKSGGALCKPLEKVGFLYDEDDVEVRNSAGAAVKLGDFYYYPCGIAAWSLFNDTLALFRGDAERFEDLELICNGTDFDLRGEPLGLSTQPNHCSKKGISWKADVEVRFKPITPAPNTWSLHYPALPTDNEYLNQGWYYREPGHPLPDPEDLDLHVWMRSAVVSNFRKMYRIIDVDLPAGNYTAYVEEYFDTVTFAGKKGIALRTSSWVGEDNSKMGVAFIALGALSFVLFVAFLLECLRQKACRGRPWFYYWISNAEWPSYVFDRDQEEFSTYYEKLLKRELFVRELNRMLKDEARQTSSQSASLEEQ